MIRNLARGIQAFTSNVFLVTGERTVLVDAGSNFEVVSRIREHTDDLDAVVLTHTHHDHVDNVADVRQAFDVETSGYDPSQPTVDVAIADEELVQLGDAEYRALHTPGHKNDHLCFYSPETGVLFAGDLIFANGSFGRTDLDEGDRDALVASIDRVADVVGDDLAVMHAGHGPSVEQQPKHNVELARQAARTR